jgi:hypothetical protein
MNRLQKPKIQSQTKVERTLRYAVGMRMIRTFIVFFILTGCGPTCLDFQVRSKDTQREVQAKFEKYKSGGNSKVFFNFLDRGFVDRNSFPYKWNIDSVETINDSAVKSEFIRFMSCNQFEYLDFVDSNTVHFMPIRDSLDDVESEFCPYFSYYIVYTKTDVVPFRSSPNFTLSKLSKNWWIRTSISSL